MNGQIKDVMSLDNGTMEFNCPWNLSNGDVSDLRDWMKLLDRRLNRIEQRNVRDEKGCAAGFLPCLLSRGGFSSERCYRVALGDGRVIRGISCVEYVRDSNMARIAECETGPDVEVPGFVQFRVIGKRRDVYTVEFPSSERAEIDSAVLDEALAAAKGEG